MLLYVAIDLAAVLVIVGFWFRLARPALARTGAPSHVRRAALWFTLLALGVYLVGLVAVVANLNLGGVGGIVAFGQAPWVFLVLLDWPRFPRLTWLINRLERRDPG